MAHGGAGLGPNVVDPLLRHDSLHMRCHLCQRSILKQGERSQLSKLRSAHLPFVDVNNNGNAVCLVNKDGNVACPEDIILKDLGAQWRPNVDEVLVACYKCCPEREISLLKHGVSSIRPAAVLQTC